MKKVILFLGNIDKSEELINKLKLKSKCRLVGCDYFDTSYKDFCKLEKGSELKNIIEYLGDCKVRAVINKADYLELLHGQLVDYYKVKGPSYQSVLSVKNKAKLHELMLEKDLGFYRPRTLIVDLGDVRKSLKYVQFPIVIKPFAGAKSRGVFTLRSLAEYDEIEQNLKKHFENERSSLINNDKADGKVLIEEFIDGKQVSVTCYVDDKGKLHIICFVDVLTAKDVGQNHMQLIYRFSPSKQREPIRHKIEYVLQKIVRASGLKSVCLHPEFFVVGKKVYLIEINVRVGGFRDGLAKLSHGIDLYKIVYNLAMGKVVEDDFESVKSAAACEVWEEKSGVIEELALPKSKYIKKQSLSFKAGQEYLAPPIGNKPLATFFVSCDDNSLAIAKKIRKNVRIKWKE